MENKKIIILVIAGILAVGSLFYGITAGPKKSQFKTVSKDTPATESKLPENGIKRRAKRTDFKTWGRNPFFPGSVQQAASPGSGLVLQGVVASGKNFKAMISGVIVGKGERVAGYTVVDIKKDKVIVNDGTNDIELRLK